MPEITPRPEPLTPFQRLEDLTRRIVAVPKTEVDKLREKRTRPKRPSSRRS